MNQLRRMADEMTILSPSDVVFMQLRNFKVEGVGSEEWLDQKCKLHNFNMQVMYDANVHDDRTLLTTFMASGQLQLLVQEAIGIKLWWDTLARCLTYIDSRLRNNPLIYEVSYYDDIVHSLLEVTLKVGVVSSIVKDVSVELSDHCVSSLVELIRLNSYELGDAENAFRIHRMRPLMRPRMTIAFYRPNIRCISILLSLTKLPNDFIAIDLVRRMIVKHKLPAIVMELLLQHPWRLYNTSALRDYIDDQWMLAQGLDPTKHSKYEVISWSLLKELLSGERITYFLETDWYSENLEKIDTELDANLLSEMPFLQLLKESIGQLRAAHLNLITLGTLSSWALRHQLTQSPKQQTVGRASSRLGRFYKIVLRIRNVIRSYY